MSRRPSPSPGHWTLLAILVAALAVRLLLVWATSGVGLNIVDEQHYATLATNLVDGNGLAWGPDKPTSIRPPLFPFVVAGVWKIAEPGDLTAVRIAQIPLALATVAMVYWLSRRLFNTKVAAIAASVVAVYPSLLFSGVLVLSEVLFTAMLVLTLCGLVVLLERPAVPVALATGLALGAAALTRSVMWPFLPVVALGGFFLLRGPTWTRLTLVATLVLGYACVVAPWSIRNTRLQGTFTVIDTMGGLNLMMGNYEYTPEDRMWDAVALTGEQAWSARLPAHPPGGGEWSEGKKERWASTQAREYVLSHPVTFFRRALLKFADFWGIERDFVAGVQRGLYSPPRWFFVAASLAIVGTYALVMVLAVLGVCLSPPSLRPHLVLLSVVIFICGVHTVVFGHPRYHLPLVPILAMYAAAAVEARAWSRLSMRTASSAVVFTLLVGLGGIWGHELLVRDADRLSQLARMVSPW